MCKQKCNILLRIVAYCTEILRFDVSTENKEVAYAETNIETGGIHRYR